MNFTNHYMYLHLNYYIQLLIDEALDFLLMIGIWE